jgi:hypothetical protein
LPVNEKAAEKFVLRLIQTQFHLRDGAPENQNKSQRKQHDGQFDRREKLVEPIQHFSISRP